MESNLILSDNEIESNIISYNKIEENRNIEDLNVSKYLVKFEIEAKINEEKKYTSGFGILCDIPYKNIKILLTYNHFLNFDFLNEGKKMILYINKEEKEININITRYKYTNENLDISIIEILESDNLKNFIEIDKFIQSRNYIGANIISVFLNENGDFEYSYSKVLEKNDENYNCSIETRSEGLILSKDNNKFIGIMKEYNMITMNTIINNINFIKCIYNISKDNLDLYIKILNDRFGEFKDDEINGKIQIIINGEILLDDFKYEFEEEGTYLVYAISNIALTNLFGMFLDCSLLTEIDFSSFNTEKVTNMSHLFRGCSSLKKINQNLFNTENVTDMSYMFNDCHSLKKIDLIYLKSEKITNMSHMFSNCRLLENIDLTSLNTDN